MNTKTCNCPKCLRTTRQEDNVERAQLAEVAVICTVCGHAAMKRVGVVLRARGKVRCDNCDGRRK